MNQIEPDIIVVREMIDVLIQGTQKIYFDSIYPIYQATNRSKPEAIGTSFLITISEKYYLVSAAHVVDINKESTLYIGMKSGLEVLDGNFLITNPPLGDRKFDKFDFAFIQLSDVMIERFGRQNFINLNGIQGEGVADVGNGLYVALGYPTSRNKPKPDHVYGGHHIKAKAWAYGATIVSDEEVYKRLGVTTDTHLCLKFNPKYSRGKDGERVKSLNPQGASGGVLVRAICESGVPSIVGILISVHEAEKVILATRVSCLLEVLNLLP